MKFRRGNMLSWFSFDKQLALFMKETTVKDFIQYLKENASCYFN